MSCVLTNRIVLNVRAVSKDGNHSRLPTSHSQKGIELHDISFSSPETLTSYELNQLRKMRAERPIDIHHNLADDFPLVALS